MGEDFFLLFLLEKKRKDSGRWTIEGAINPSLLHMALDVAKTKNNVEAARIDDLEVLSSTLVFMLRRRFLGQQSG